MSRVPAVTCPMLHVTHEMLACDAKSLCKKLDRNGEWYSTKCKRPHGVSQPYFYCGVSGEFLPYSLLCDFREDCTGGRDEDFCLYPPCKGHMFSCGQGQCVHVQKICDGTEDCLNGDDEDQCPVRNVKRRIYNKKPPAVINFERPVGFTVTTLPENTSQCPDTHFQCHDGGYCLPVFVRCNDVNDCPGHEDEARCKHVLCPGFYRCRGDHTTVCVHMDHLCDGWPQCPQHDDELMCDLTCPGSCTCSGLAFTCTDAFQVRSFPQLRYLEARGSGLHQHDVRSNIMLIHLGVQACGWTNVTQFTLYNLHSLDLSDNKLSYINISHLSDMPSIRIINLANNPLSLSRYKLKAEYSLPSLIVFNVSQVQLESFNMSNVSPTMPNLQVLDLSHSGITSLQGENVFFNLRVLDIRGCPVSYFSPDFMKSMNYLKHVFADNSKLCCPSVLPDFFSGDCLAPTDGISCDDLLRYSTYRFSLIVFAVLTIFGNFSSFLYRLCFSSERFKNGFSIFVLHLCISDFLMGVYLVIIGVADRTFAGVYIWNEIAWRKSLVCSIAGFLSFLSSEVSAFFICVITLDRFLVLHFPFSRIRFSAMSAHKACAIVWVLGLSLSTIPLLPVTSHWEFYQQTGICIPLPITKTDFAGHSYSFSVMIVCNLVLFLLIAVGQSLVYWSVSSNTMYEHMTETKSKDTASVRSKEAVIARRLFSVAVSDFLCWFPVGLCGLLSASDVTIPEEINVALAIFILPLNSALNPCLYTLNVVLEKRQKVKERRLCKFIQAQLKSHSVH